MAILDFFKKRREKKMNKLFERANDNLENNLNLFGRGSINEQECFSTVSFFTAEIISYGADLVGYEKNLPVNRIAGIAMIISCFMVIRLDCKIKFNDKKFIYKINDRVFDEIKEHNRALDRRRIDDLHQSSKYVLGKMSKKTHDYNSLIDFTCKEILREYQSQREFDISHELDEIEANFKFFMNKYELSLEKRMDIIASNH